MADQLDTEDASEIEVHVSTAAGTVTVALTGELDLSNVDAVEAQIGPALTPRPAQLILDLAALRFADSAAITVWLHWAAAADRFELRDPPVVIRQVLSAMGLAAKLGLVT